PRASRRGCDGLPTTLDWPSWAAIRCVVEAAGWRGASMIRVRRREFITLVGAAAAWPVSAHAQRPTMPVIGFLRSTSLAVSTPMTRGFRQGLTRAGFTEGQKFAVEYRYADNHPERLPGLVAELIRLPVAVIFGNLLAALAAKAATTTVPIVFATGSDPVVDGL